MAELARWHDLACSCGNTTFVKLYTLRHHSGGGSSESETGKRCAACGKDADTGAMWKQVQLQRTKAQLQELERLLGEAEGTPPTPISTSSEANAT